MNLLPLLWLVLFWGNMHEVATLAILAATTVEECKTFLRLVLAVEVVLALPQLIGSMGELAFIVVGAVAQPYEVPAQFVLELWVATIAVVR